MIWVFTISPEIEGVSVTADSDHKATLHGHPLHAFAGSVTVTASNGVISVDRVLNLQLVPIDKVSIEAIENQSQVTNSVTFEFTNLEVSIVEDNIVFGTILLYSSELSQHTQFTLD